MYSEEEIYSVSDHQKQLVFIMYSNETYVNNSK